MTGDKILVVEDDPSLRETLQYNLRKENCAVTTAADGELAIAAARREHPDLIILDLMLPKISGLEVCRTLRREMTVPILMLTARAEETEKIVGLEIGADDYMTKPFSMGELLARVRAMLRRAHMTAMPPAGEKLRAGDIEVDIPHHQAYLAGAPLELTPKEFDLLAFLARNRGLVFGREQLLEKVWGYEYAGDSRTVDVHIRWLRQKIEEDPAHPERLITIRGAGYKLEG